jgi:hypothetical protein
VYPGVAVGFESLSISRGITSIQKEA